MGLNAVQMTLVIAGILALLIGGVAIRIVWFGRRKGASLHCRKCSYNLQGLKSDRCPECGVVLAAGNIVKGQRVRRPRLAGIAVVLMLVGIGLLGVGVSERVRGVDWYSYKPTGWVIDDLKSADVAVYDRAWKEIEGRQWNRKLSSAQMAKLRATAIAILSQPNVSNRDALLQFVYQDFSELTDAQKDAAFDLLLRGIESRTNSIADRDLNLVASLRMRSLISPSQYDRLIELGLKAQAAPLSYIVEEWLMKFLGDCAAAGKLSAARRERFFNQAMAVSLVVRPEVIAGESTPYQIRVGGNGPEDKWWSSERFISLSVDDETPVEKESGSSEPLQGFSHGSHGSSIKVDRPGKHVLHAEYQIAAYFHEKDPTPTDQPIWSRTIKLSAPFAVLAADTKDSIQLIDDPAAADLLRRAITFDRNSHSKDHAAVGVRISNSPVNIAFEVFARVDGKEYAFGEVTANAGDSYSTMVESGKDFPLNPHKNIDLIFRSSQRVARRTIDLYEIWSGELIFPNITLAY